MAIQGPVGKENLNISFKLNSKSHVFDGSTNGLVNARLSIVAAASSFGIVFVGSTNAEILVIQTKSLELPTALNQNAPVRKIPMPSQITQLATNCDGSILAVDTKINGVPHIQLYSVPSFLSPNVQKIREFRLSADSASSVQLCWNPVLNTILAACTESGGLNLYAFKEQGIEFHSIDPSLKAKCCCWSPKGKQIVAGFANGKLMQFNMELKPARIIDCPPGIYPGSFDAIAVQWLSTYQFAIAFLSHQAESRPVLHILNAPKAGPPQYIAYNDVCFIPSQSRPSKIYLQYIQAWGMLLIASANCIDVSFLKISKPGDIPEWTQEFPNDQFPAELPLTDEKDESFPVGFEVDTACTGRLLQEDGNPYPVMPMIHIISTYGVLCSFYVLNTTATYADICSPPRPIDPRIESLFAVSQIAKGTAVKASADDSIFKTPIKSDPTPITHSTPTLPPPKPNLFAAAAPAAPSLFSLVPQNPTNVFGSVFGATVNPQPKPLPQQPTGFQMSLTNPVAPIQPQNKTLLATPPSQPLITVPPIYNPAQQKPDIVKEPPVNEKLSEAEDEQIYVRMIQDEIKAFELELNFLMDKSRSLKVNIGTKEESADMRKKLEELDDLKKEATETIESLKSDVQTNRLGLTELFSMVYEAKAKNSQANNERSIIMPPNQIQDRSIRRTLDNLRKMMSHCELQIHVIVQLLNSQWANYQDTLSKTRKGRMHIPSLEGVYQTLTKQQEIIYNLSGRLKLLKSKLGICDDVKKMKNANVNATIESLSDSIISMSLVDQVQMERSKLTGKKHKNLLNYLENREVVTIKPQRPKLPGLNSEIIIEKKIKAMKSLKKPEPKKSLVPQQKDVKSAVPASIVQNKQPTADFSSSIQKTTNFAPVLTSQLTFGKKEEPQLTFGKKDELSFVKKDEPATISLAKKDEQPKNAGFSFAGAAQPNFGFNMSSMSAPFSASVPQSTFGTTTGFSASSLSSSIEKRKEEPKIQSLQVVPKITNEVKPVSTISNANVSVTANFSVSLPPKTSPPSIKDVKKVDEKKVEEIKPLTTNESTSFTFSLPGKKEIASVQPTSKAGSVITFGNEPSAAVSSSVKSAFSFSAASNPAFSFGSSPKVSDVKTTLASSSTSIFGGSTNVSFGFGDSAAKPATTSTNIFATGNTISISKTTEETKTDSTVSSSTSVFGVKSAALGSDTKNIFASAIPATTISSTSINAFSFAPKNEISPPISTNPIPTTSSPLTPPSSTDSVLQGLSICSPLSSTQTDTSPSNIFASALPATAKSESSIFGSNSFAPSTTTSSIFSSPTATTQSSTSIFAQPTSTVQATSAFGGLDLSTKPTSPSTDGASIFAGSLVKPDQSVFGQQSPTIATTTSSGTFSNIFAATNVPKTTSTFGSPPSTNIFSQGSPGSVFGQTPTSNASIFAAPATTASNASIFAAPATTASNSGGSIFSQSTFSTPPVGATTGSIFGGSSAATQSPFGTASIFGSGNQQQPSQQSTSIFGGNSNTFAQSSNATPSGGGGNIFGGSPAPAQNSTSPFGSSNIFAQSQPTFGGTATFSSGFGQGGFGTSGGSIFSQQTSQPVFGGTATFGSPKSNVFGGQAPVSPPQAQTGNIFEQLGSQQSGNLFGSLAQTTPPQVQQQHQQQQGGFMGSAFSSWR